MYYLSEKSWSHRFEKRFFTIKCDNPSTSYETSPYSESDIGGRTKLPAFYYTVEVCAGSTDPLKIFRRYSEFEWLHHKLKSDPLLSASASTSADNDNKMFPTLPPKTSFCQVQTDDFRFDRQIELKEFLDDVLSTPGCASHPAMKSFLLLNHIYGEEDEAGSETDEIVDLEALAKLKEQYDKEGVEDDCVTPPTEEEVVTEEEPVEETVVETAVALESEEEVVAAAVEEETTEEAKEKEEIAQEPSITQETTEIAQDLEPATTKDKAEEVAQEAPAPPAEEVAQEVEAPPAVEETAETEEEVGVDADDIPTEALKEESAPPEEETKEQGSEVEVQTTSPSVEEESEKEETPVEEVVEEAKTESPSPPAEEESEEEAKTESLSPPAGEETKTKPAVKQVKEKAAEVTTDTA